MGKTIEVFGFPSNVTVDEVRKCLEKHTGEGTVEALEIRQPRNGGPMRSAEVQFTSSNLAKWVVSQSGHIFCGRNYLKARERDRDITAKPRTFAHSMDEITLHFGCQTSDDQFSVLWNVTNVSVKFGLGLRKYYFFISYNFMEYKLELSYENIWQIELRRPHHRNRKFLLVQVHTTMFDCLTFYHSLFISCSFSPWVVLLPFPLAMSTSYGMLMFSKLMKLHYKLNILMLFS